MKRILAAVVLIIMIVSMIGCTKLVETEYETVEVKIIGEYYRAAWYQPIIAGKVHSIIFHPAQYCITVEYDGEEHIINDRQTYDAYKDKINETVDATLEVRLYDDGTTRYDIISLP